MIYALIKRFPDGIGEVLIWVIFIAEAYNQTSKEFGIIQQEVSRIDTNDKIRTLCFFYIFMYEWNKENGIFQLTNYYVS